MTQARLKELLIYCVLTGLFMWRVNRGRIKVGSIAGCKDYDDYILIRIDGTLYKAHRLAFLYMEGEFPPDQVDHINGVEDDNRWCNLRKCTLKQNMNNPITKHNLSYAAKGNKNCLNHKLSENHKRKISVTLSNKYICKSG